MASLI
jgi:hypothetical protein